MSIEGVKATFREGDRLTNEGKATLQRAAAEISEITDLARSTLHDSQHEDVQAAFSKLVSASREARLALRRFDEATSHTEQFLKAL